MVCLVLLNLQACWIFLLWACDGLCVRSHQPRQRVGAGCGVEVSLWQ
jgi:hypothetical protein